MKKERPYLRARVDKHLFEAFRRKIYLDNCSAAMALNSILSNYFVYHQKYLKPENSYIPVNIHPSNALQYKNFYYNDTEYDPGDGNNSYFDENGNNEGEGELEEGDSND